MALEPDLVNVSGSTNGGVPGENWETEKRDDSYNQILKSTSIIGGSQAINYLIGMFRTKIIALLLGPSGVGLIGLFQSSVAIVTELTGFGIANSGVRQIAEAHGTGDAESVGKTLRILRRACWVTGILGWIVTVCLARPLSIWVFDSPKNAWLIALLGATLLLTAVSGGQRALIQGTRRIADLARMTVISSLASSIVAVAIYAVFGENGIVPALIVTALISLGVSWWFAKRVSVPQSGELTWQETIHESKQLTGLGAAFMWGGLLRTLVDLATRALILREVGVDGTGIYQAVWALSGMFANFILSAMGADFYPRLTAMVDDHELFNSTANEQIEIGVLIALPGLLGTMAMGPLVLTIFYTSDFAAGAAMMPWFLLGIFFRVFSWPLGFTILAKGATRWFLLTTTTFRVIQMTTVLLLIKPFGLVGVSIAFVIPFLPAIFLNLFVANRLSGFFWSTSVIKLLAISGSIILACFASAVLLPASWNMAICGICMVGAGIWSVREIVKRVGMEHRITRKLLKMPGMSFLMAGMGTDSTN